jgi:hypothetical protein
MLDAGVAGVCNVGSLEFAMFCFVAGMFWAGGRFVFVGGTFWRTFCRSTFSFLFWMIGVRYVFLFLFVLEDWSPVRFPPEWFVRGIAVESVSVQCHWIVLDRWI